MSLLNRGPGLSQTGSSRSFYHLLSANDCQICLETCRKARRLPCEHEFCKDCLHEYFEKIIPDEDPNTSFPCPFCNKPTEKPAIPKSKWTETFKPDKRTMFYEMVDDITRKYVVSAPEGYSGNSWHLSTSKPIQRRATAPCRSLLKESDKRSAVLFAGVYKEHPGFDTTVSTDETESVYWGGVISHTGNIVLPDFYNRCIKVFTQHGNHVYHTKIPLRPFDVTEIHDSTIVVSHGSKETCVTILSYDKEKLRCTRRPDIQGYLFNVTRKGKHCLGIFETIEGEIRLARISAEGRMVTRDPKELMVFLSTGSHIKFSEKDKLYYFTEKRNFLCTDTSFTILFLKSYPYLETDHYFLGSIALDSQGTLFIGSDLCVLRIDKEGNALPSTIPTKIDPYHILVTSDGSKLIIVGRSNSVSAFLTSEMLL